MPEPQTVGKVYLVGAGPGDAGLLTVRAAELIRSADVVALDALVSRDIASQIPATTEVIYVGKRAGAHSVPQDRINALLIAEAKKGRVVVRLKGGDPFVFGRGGEEAEELLAAGVPIEVVPGISSAIAGPAYAGIPVTHRTLSTSVTLVTGHEAESGSTGIQWEPLAKLDGTIVFLMGFANLDGIVRNLTAHGMSADRGCAVISRATRSDQKTVAGTLATIEKLVAEAQMQTPALIVVGNVVALHQSINWFESRPLFGRRVVVTRAREQASELRRLLAASGAEVLEFPMIEIAPPETFDSLDHVIGSSYDWLIFTSSNGVRAYFDRLFEKGRDVRSIRAKVACVGESTAAALRGRGISPDLVPERFLSTALLPHLEPDQTGIRSAVIRAAEGRDDLIDELRRRGGQVDLGIAYRTVGTDHDLDELRALITSDAIDVVTFTSGSTVEHFFSHLSAEEIERLLAKATLASIGPTTSAALAARARKPDIEADEASVESLHEAVVKLGSEKR